MRITAIRERPVRLHGGPSGGPANAVINFSCHTVSLVAVLTDAIRDGKPVVGVAFDSIGRFAQSGILRDRMIPRVLAAPRMRCSTTRDASTRPPFWRARSLTRSPEVTGTGQRRPPPLNWRAGTSTPSSTTNLPT